MKDEKDKTSPADSSLATGLLDPTVLLAACGGDPTMLRKMCRTLQSLVPEYVAVVRDALHDQDAPRLREAAHKCSDADDHADAVDDRVRDAADRVAGTTSSPTSSGLVDLPSPRPVRWPCNRTPASARSRSSSFLLAADAGFPVICHGQSARGPSPAPGPAWRHRSPQPRMCEPKPSQCNRAPERNVTVRQQRSPPRYTIQQFTIVPGRTIVAKVRSVFSPA